MIKEKLKIATTEQEEVLKQLKKLQERNIVLSIMIQTYEDLIKTQTNITSESGESEKIGIGE